MNYTFVIVGAFVGFLVLAGILLIPVWRFLKRQEEEADHYWSTGKNDARKSSDVPE